MPNFSGLQLGRKTRAKCSSLQKLRIGLYDRTESVFYPFWTECLNSFRLIFGFIGRAMAQAVSLRRLTTEARVQSQVSLYEICGGQSGTGTGFSPSPSVFPVSTMPPMLHIHIHLLPMWLREDKRAKPGNVRKSVCRSEIGEHCIEKYFHFVFKGLILYRPYSTYMLRKVTTDQMTYLWHER